MAALTAASVIRENVGSLTLHVVSFTSVTGDDTWASGLSTSVVGFWANDTNAGGSTLVVGVNVKNASGTFTFQTSVAAHPITLYVVSKS
jgi:hypothetical protein